MILSNEIVSETIRYLNEHTKVQFSTNQPMIEKWINEGYGFDDFKAVIDKKYNDWKGTKFLQFIRPKTLFGDKFLEYLNEQPKQSSIHKLADSINRVQDHNWKLN
jgi:uncharacterized phage protein (TIGR02220 family)